MRDILPVLRLHLDAMIRTRAERDIWQAARHMAALRNITQTDVIDQPFPAHPLHDYALQQMIASIREYARRPSRERHVTISINDSLIALRADQCTAVDIHCGISGLGGLQYSRVIRDIAPVLRSVNISPAFVVLGCIVGNMLLSRYAWSRCESEFRQVYSDARRTWPQARIILYGLPPVFDLYLTEHTWLAEQLMIDTVRGDVAQGNNAVFVSLKRFATMGLWPRARLFSDGVHLSDRGFIRFDALLNRAHYADNGSIIT
jgi:hypothetical protein